MAFPGVSGTGSGAIRYALLFDTRQAEQAIGTFKAGLTSLGPATQQTNRNLAALGTSQKGLVTQTTQTTKSINDLGIANKNLLAPTQQSTKAVKDQAVAMKAITSPMQQSTKSMQQMVGQQGPLAAGLQKTTGAAKDMVAQTSRLGAQTQGLGSKIKTVGSQFSTTAIGISATATSSLQLAAGFRDYSDAQIAVERVTRKNSLAHEALTKAQDKLAKLTASGVTSGKEYAQAQLDVQQAEQMVSIQTQLLGEAQERLFDSQSQFIVSIVPTVLGAFGSISSAFKDFNVNATTLKNGITSIGSLISGAGSKAATAAGGLFTFSKGMDAAAISTNAATAALLKFGPAIGAVIGTLIGNVIKQSNADIQKNSDNFDKWFTDMLDNIPLVGDAWKGFHDMMIKMFPEFATEAQKAKVKTDELKESAIKGAGAQTKEGAAIAAKTAKEKAAFNAMSLRAEKYQDLALGANLESSALEDDVTQYGNYVAAQTDTRSVEEQLTAAREENAAANALENKRMQEGIQAAGDVSGETEKLVGSIMKLNEVSQNATTQGIGALYEIMGKTTTRVEEDYKQQQLLNEAWQNAHVDAIALNDDMISQAKALGASTDFLQNYTAGVGDNDEAIQKHTDALHRQLPALAQQNNLLRLGADAWKVNVDAQVKGIQAAGDLVIGMKSARIESQAFTSQLDTLAKSGDKDAKMLADLQQEYGLTAEETKKVASGTQNEAEVFANLAEVMHDKAIPAVTDFEEKITSLRGKDVGKTISELDFGKFKGMGKFGDAVEKAGKKLGKFGEAAGHFQDTVAGIGTALDLNVDFSDIESGVDNLVKQFDKMKKQDDTLKGMTGFRDMLKNIGSPEDWAHHAKSISMFNEMAAGGFDDVEKAAIEKQVAIENGQTADEAATAATAESIDPLDQQARQLNQVSINSNDLQVNLANLANEGTKSLDLLGAASSENMSGMENNLNVGYEAVTHLQTNIANLANQGSKSLSVLAKNSSTAMNGLVNNVRFAQKAIISLIKTIGNLHSKAITITTNHVDTFKKVQLAKGFQGVVSNRMDFTAGEAGPEYVSVTPLKPGSQATSQSYTGGRNMAGLTVNLTNVLADREIIRVYRRKLGEDMYRFGPS